jgi:murein DD-endopeptidase MepM/ murein hydrolase activator NlpD
MDDRKLTLIVVPHGDLETRSYEISYRKLLALVISVAALLLFVAGMAAFLFPVFAQAARASQLAKEVERLESERASVAELARTLEQVEAQYERVRSLLGADAVLDDAAAPLLPPINRDTSRRESQFEDEVSLGIISTWPLESRGFITQVLSEARPNHSGLNIAVAENSYIRAAGDGVVRQVASDRVYGNFAIIDHGSGLETLYGHASRILVRKGDRVRGNDVIGLTGSSGQSTGPHLHFEVRRDGRPVDPLLFVRQP